MALSQAEACKLLGCSRAKLYRLTKSGQIRSSKIDGRRWISEASLTAYREERRLKYAELA